MKKGKWTVPGICLLREFFYIIKLNFRCAGYKEKFGDLSLA